MRRLLLPLFALPVLACQPPEPDSALPEPICHETAPWASGGQAFRDATADFGLDLTGAEGVRINAADVDGDGWTDLLVRRGGVRQDDFAAGTRHTFLLKNDQGTFVDVTEESGLLATRLGGELGRAGEVFALGDVDNDGDLDVYTGLDTSDLGKSMGETSEVMLQVEPFRFELGPRDSAARRPGEVDVPAGASFVDYDRDGVLDLFVSQHNYSPSTGGVTFLGDRLLQGRGDGGFDDVSAEVGLVTQDWIDVEAINQGQAHSRAWGAAACDLNDDGLPELLVPSYGRSPNHLWQARRGNNGVRFDNRSVASGYAYDDDFTWQDNQFARCYCEANRDAEGCADVPAPAITCTSANWSHAQDREPFRLGGNSAATVCADLDNDGDIDLLTSEIRHWWAGAGSDAGEVLLNDGGDDVTFTRPGRAALGLEVPHSGLSWDEGHMTAAALDFDNDGWLDLYVGGSDYTGNRGRLYHQRDALAFEEVDPSEGVDQLRSHGVAVADFDRDGDLDLVVGHSHARCDGECYPTQQVRLFENTAGESNFVQLVLEGTGANRAAIGARVRITAGGVTQTRDVSGGYGHYGAQDDLVVHAGLGAACEADVEVRWPDDNGTVQRFTLPAGYRFRLTQGDKPVVVE
jgi:hypothetical protein